MTTVCTLHDVDCCIVCMSDELVGPMLRKGSRLSLAEVDAQFPGAMVMWDVQCQHMHVIANLRFWRTDHLIADGDGKVVHWHPHAMVWSRGSFGISSRPRRPPMLLEPYSLEYTPADVGVRPWEDAIRLWHDGWARTLATITERVDPSLATGKDLDAIAELSGVL